MGTRGLLGLIIQAQRHAAYNHYDSYPDALGQQIVDFILGLSPEDMAAMVRLVAEITWVDSESKPSTELQKYYSELDFADLEVSDKSFDDWYCLLRKVQGAKALPQVLNGKLKHLEEWIDFLDDKVMCEWSYIIDFEKEKLETWTRATLKDEVTFEELRQQGDSYMERLQKEGR